MKKFIFDRLVDKENICNFKKEIKKIRELIKNNLNIVLYAPRNYGKTSLLKNVIIPEFVKNNSKKVFVFFADLFQVKDIESIVSRLSVAFERSFEKSFPVKSVFDNIKNMFGSTQPEINIDPVTNSINVSITPIIKKKSYSIQSIFEIINKISQKIPTIVMIDEFQDISSVPEAEALFRTSFQAITSLPIILSGSKRHILTNMFANPDSPLYSWGVDVKLNAIDYMKYYSYMQERFNTKNIEINLDISKKIQDMMNRIPEAVNILCYNLMELYPDKIINNEMIYNAFNYILENRESRYETYLGLLSKTEERILICLARESSIEQKTGKNFVSLTGYTPKTVSKTVDKLYNMGIIEKHNKKYRIADPLLNGYLRKYR